MLTLLMTVCSLHFKLQEYIHKTLADGDKNKKEALEYTSVMSTMCFFFFLVLCTSTDNEDCAHEVPHTIVELWF